MEDMDVVHSILSQLIKKKGDGSENPEAVTSMVKPEDLNKDFQSQQYTSGDVNNWAQQLQKSLNQENPPVDPQVAPMLNEGQTPQMSPDQQSAPDVEIPLAQNAVDNQGRYLASKNPVTGLEETPSPSIAPTPSVANVGLPAMGAGEQEKLAGQKAAELSSYGVIPEESPATQAELARNRETAKNEAINTQLKEYNPAVEHLNKLWDQSQAEYKKATEFANDLETKFAKAPEDMVARNGFWGKLGYVAANLLGMGPIADKVIDGDLKKQVFNWKAGIDKDKSLFALHMNLYNDMTKAYEASKGIYQGYAQLKAQSVMQKLNMSDPEIMHQVFSQQKAAYDDQFNKMQTTIKNNLELAKIEGARGVKGAEMQLRTDIANQGKNTKLAGYQTPTSQDLKVMPELGMLRKTGNQMTLLEKGLDGVDMSKYLESGLIHSYLTGEKSLTGMELRKAISDIGGKAGLVNPDKIARYLTLAQAHARAWAQSDPKGRSSVNEIGQILPMIIPPTIGGRNSLTGYQLRETNMQTRESGLSPGGGKYWAENKKKVFNK